MQTLTQRSAFVRASKQGRAISTKGILLQTVENGLTISRVGITASSRLGGAVQRNRIKRRLRALVREQVKEDALHAKGGLFVAGFDYVLIGRHTTIMREYTQLRGDLRYALHQMKNPVIT